MYLNQNPSTRKIERKLWKRSNTPRLNIVKQLLSKLQDELAVVNDTAQVKFDGKFNLYQQIRTFEIDMIRHALFLTNNNQRLAARMLGINYTTLNSKVKRYGIELRIEQIAPDRN